MEGGEHSCSVYRLVILCQAAWGDPATESILYIWLYLLCVLAILFSEGITFFTFFFSLLQNAWQTHKCFYLINLFLKKDRLLFHVQYTILTVVLSLCIGLLLPGVRHIWACLHGNLLSCSHTTVWCQTEAINLPIPSGWGEIRSIRLWKAEIQPQGRAVSAALDRRRRDTKSNNWDWNASSYQKASAVLEKEGV